MLYIWSQGIEEILSSLYEIVIIICDSCKEYEPRERIPEERTIIVMEVSRVDFCRSCKYDGYNVILNLCEQPL